MTIHNFAEANRYLARFYDNSHTSYTLDNMRVLMAYLGDPQEKFKVVHVAGTSGKTSTSYYAAALLRQAGFKVGLTVSPHVDEINERVQINGQVLPETEFCTALSEFLELIKAAPVKPSWFEVMVAFAYWYFALAEVEYAVIEVGLGGLKDGTNVVKRHDKVCIITDIGLDHTQILGNTLAEIAAQKAGIIQPGNQVFMYRQSPEVVSVVRSAVATQQAALQLVKPVAADNSGLPGFQQRNFHLALQAIKYILRRDRLPKLMAEQIQNARSQTYIPGRMEIIYYPDKIVILDGAHNAQKLQALIDSIKTKYPNRRVAILASFAEGDDDRLNRALETLSQLSNKLIITNFATAKDYLKHSADLKIIAAAAERQGFKVELQSGVEKAFSKLLITDADVLLVTGSFYLLNHIRPLMLKV